MNGILVVDKQEGYTSRDVVNVLNKELGTKKIGHTGTLDPIATGVLVICIGKYTKLVSDITAYDKEYIAQIKLGIKTDTQDRTGTIIEEKKFEVTEEKIKKVFESFLGKQTQTVPKYSAVKVNGKKLYEYARKNVEVELPKREIEIKSLELISFEQDIITFKTTVSKGTYIRSLIEDICEKLGTVGTMYSLRRTKQGQFLVSDAYTLEDVKNKKYAFVNLEQILDYPIFSLKEEDYQKVLNGAKITLKNKDEKVLLKYEEEIIAIYQKEDNLFKPYCMFKTN